MRRERKIPLTTLETHIHAAFPRHPIKQVARYLGCSDRQAWRIVTTGRAPGMLRARLIGLLDRQIAKNREQLARLELELKALAHEENGGDSLDRTSSAARSNPSLSEGRVDGPARSETLT